MSPPQGLRAVKEATVGRSRRALRELRSVGEGARGKIGSGWELLRGVNQSHSRGGGGRQAEGEAGEGSTLRGGSQGAQLKLLQSSRPGISPLVSRTETYLRSGRRQWARTPQGRRRWHSS